MIFKTPDKQKPHHLLLIEDDAGVRRALQLLLQGQGYEVHSFATAVLALADPVAMTATHLVIDYALPNCNGIAAMRLLRERGWNGVSVMITAFYSDRLAADATDAGIDKVLPKPFRDDALLDALALPSHKVQ